MVRPGSRAVPKSPSRVAQYGRRPGPAVQVGSEAQAGQVGLAVQVASEVRGGQVGLAAQVVSEAQAGQAESAERADLVQGLVPTDPLSALPAAVNAAPSAT